MAKEVVGSSDAGVVATEDHNIMHIDVTTLDADMGKSYLGERACGIGWMEDSEE